MTNTRTTLLLRVKDRNDVTAWSEFHELYPPLLYRYARGRGLSRDDAEEVRDQCIEIIVRKIASFEYDKQKGGFRNWLYRIANGKVIDLLRRRREKVADGRDLQELVDPGLPPDEFWQQHWKNEHLRYCVEQVRERVSANNYQAFCMLLYEECSVADVCGRLGMNANQVYKAKSRVLRLVRGVLSELDPDLAL